MQAILMIGEQRSGSNLLRLILNSSPEIAAPHPPHILQNLMPLIPGYGDLTETTVMARLVDDVCRLVEHNPVPWEGIECFDREEVRSLCRENSLIAVFDAVMTIFAQRQGASAWLCKSMQNVRWSRELDACLDKPKFIYLYRDPRDVALSFSKAVIGDKHPYHVSKKWVELQELCLATEQMLGQEQVMRVCYEEMTSQPERIIRELCEFLGVKFIPQMLEFHRSSEANRTATKSTLWSNLTRPMMAGNSKKFLRDMPQEHVRIIESVAGPIIDRLGYERYFVQSGQEAQYTNAQIKTFDAENEQARQAMAGKTDPDDLKRRQHQLRIIDEIRHTLSGNKLGMAVS